jgi:hypothetical protein
VVYIYRKYVNTFVRYNSGSSKLIKSRKQNVKIRKKTNPGNARMR